MARKPQPGWWIYKEQLDFLRHGDALWEPAPTGNYPRIRLGDVGFIRRGQFHLLFSAGCPLGTRLLGTDVPTTFEELTVGTPVFGQPRLAGCLHTESVREVGASLGVTASTTLPVELGTYFSFKLSGNSGAALVTKYKTYREDSLLEAAFEPYIKRHYKSWVKFARDKQYGTDIQPVLVTGFDMTRDFAMAAYSNKGTSLESGCTINVPAVASASASIWGTWLTRCSTHTNFGPQQCSPTPHEEAVDPPSSQSVGAGSAPNEFNQCVFIRYYTMRSRKRMPMFPKIIRAGAGPHDLGSGDNEGGTFPELTVRSDAESATNSDEDLGRQWGLNADDDSEPDIIVRNMPYDEECDSWYAIADYVFQNSDAASVLMHHRDLLAIRTAGVAGGTPALLAKHKPRIVVDTSGVGRIVCQEIQRPRVPDVTRPAPTAETTHAASTSISPQETRVNPNTTKETKERIALIAKGKLDSKVASQFLNETFDAPDYLQAISAYSPQQQFIDGLYELLRNGPLDQPTRQRCLRALRKAGGIVGLLPTSYRISFSPQKRDATPNAAGGFSEVWKVDNPDSTDGVVFALKILRVTLQDDFLEIKKRFCKEILVAKLVEHENVLTIEGIQITEGLKLCIVSEWMDHGNLHTYLKDNEVADRMELLLGVTKGLNYLHSIEVIHGDLKSSNILIDPSGTPQLTDFGFSSITRNIFSVNASTPNGRGSNRWRAPELLVLSTKPKDQDKAKSARPTNKSDIYSLAMVAIEIFTGDYPFGPRSDEQVILLLANDERPDRPVHEQFTSRMWSLTKKCWRKDPKKRPDIPEVLGKLEPEDEKEWYSSIQGSLSALVIGRQFGDRSSIIDAEG